MGVVTVLLQHIHKTANVYRTLRVENFKDSSFYRLAHTGSVEELMTSLNWKSWTPVYTVRFFSVPQKAVNFLTSCAIINFSKRTSHNGIKAVVSKLQASRTLKDSLAPPGTKSPVQRC